MGKIERRASVTNSEWASKRLMDLGLGVDPIAEVIKRALEAKLVIYDKFGNLVAEKEDNRVQMEAAKLLSDIHGFKHVPEQKIDVPTQFIQIVNDIRQKSLAELQEEARKFDAPKNRIETIA